jgi:hypothetical protein
MEAIGICARIISSEFYLPYQPAVHRDTGQCCL